MFDFWRRRDNKNNDDEFSGIDDFDFDDFGFESTPVSNDRSPELQAAKGFATGVIGSFKDADIEQSARKVLPEEYGVIFDTKDHLKESYKEVFDHAVKEFQPYKEDIKKLAERTLSASEKILPEKLYAKLSDLVKTESTFSKESRETRERAAINAELSQIFETQIKVEQEKEKRQDKKDDIKEVIEHDRHKDIFSQLDAIRRAVLSQAEYQDNVLIRYQRKHLESEIKQTNILARLVEETVAFRTESKNALDQITKNTGLPDFVKQLGSERFKATVTQRFYDGALDKFNRSNNFISNLVREAKEGATGWISGFVNGLGQIASASSMIDTEMMEEMGISKTEMAGMFIGTGVGDWLKDKSLNKVRDIITGKTKVYGKTFPWADQVNKGGQQAQLIMGNLPYYLDKFIREAKEDANYGGVKYAGLDILDNLLTRATKERTHSLKAASVNDLFQPAIFNNRVSKSITDVIPGYLSKILRELTILRTGDSSTQELIYDHQTDKFDTRRNIGNTILKSIVSDSTRDRFRKMSKNNFSDIG